MFFCNNKIDLTKIKNKKNFLIKLGNCLYNLSQSNVCEGKLMIGGYYHKNYYKNICSGFFNGKNETIIDKNGIKSQFIYNTKYNLCNFGVYFIKEKENIYIEIFSGNGFQLDNYLENYIEKYINSSLKIIKNKVYFNVSSDYYLKKITKYKIENLHIICKNKAVKKYIKLLNICDKESRNKIIINKDLSYNLFFNNIKTDINRIVKFKHFENLTEKEIIDKINLEKLKNVANVNNNIYNKDVNYFDIFYTISLISKSLKGITYDKNKTKLV